MRELLSRMERLLVRCYVTSNGLCSSGFVIYLWAVTSAAARSLSEASGLHVLVAVWSPSSYGLL